MMKRHPDFSDKTRDAAYLIHLANKRLKTGIIHEPRGFFDVIELRPDGEISPGHPEVFRNGEPFPIKITHMLAAVAFIDQEGDPDTDENLINRIGMRLRFHDQFYMNPEFLPLPAWSNVPVAAAPEVSFGTSAWLTEPFILSARDAMIVDVEMLTVPDDDSVPITVTFTGIGMLSYRPYLFSETADIESTAATTLSSVNYMNKGTEPVMITDMTVTIGGANADPDPTGEIRRARIQVRQAGNGTETDWFQGPVGDVIIPRIPTELLGQLSGRAVVHEFPIPLSWEPADGIDVFVRGLGENPPEISLDIAVLGYVIVT